MQLPAHVHVRMVSGARCASVGTCEACSVMLVEQVLQHTWRVEQPCCASDMSLGAQSHACGYLSGSQLLTSCGSLWGRLGSPGRAAIDMGCSELQHLVQLQASLQLHLHQAPQASKLAAAVMACSSTGCGEMGLQEPAQSSGIC